MKQTTSIIVATWVICLGLTLVPFAGRAAIVLTANLRYSQGANGVTANESISFHIDVVNATDGQPVANAFIDVSLKNSSNTTVWSQSSRAGTDGSAYFLISPSARQGSTGQHTIDVVVKDPAQTTQATLSRSIMISVSSSTPAPSTNPLTQIKRQAEEPIRFTPEITIPNFGGNGEVTVTGQTIAEYIRAVFIYFIWGVGILAVVMITYGGVRWVAAAGNAARINDARETVNNAIIGLIIALTSVLLLNIINPNLTKFVGLTPVVVTTEVLQLDTAPGEHNEAGTCKTVPKGTPVQKEDSCVVANANFIWPVTATHVIKSRVGPRTQEVGSSCHPGTDFATDGVTGKPVIAIFNGTITSIIPGCHENVVVLKSSDGYYVRYVHVHSTTVRQGQGIQQGGIIGYSGGDRLVAVGCSTGPHVHVELYDKNGTLHDVAPCVAPAQ